MEEAIKARVSSKDVQNHTEIDFDSISELILDGSRIKCIDRESAAHLSRFKNLETLCMNSVGLHTIEDFPFLPKLKILEIQDNLLSGSSLNALSGKVPNLVELSIAGNRFSTLDEISFLKEIESLRLLDVELNPLARDPNYRQSAFQYFPQIQTIDEQDRNGHEIDGPSDGSEEEDEEEEDESGDGATDLKKFYEADLSEVSDEDDVDFEVDGVPDGEDDDDVDDDVDDTESENSTDEETGGGTKRSETTSSNTLTSKRVRN